MQESFSPRHKWRDLRDCATASVSDAQIATMVNGMKASIDKIPLGITDDEVPLGSHLIHFWQTDEEFERGVRFLELGIADEFQHCVLFGHDEANHRQRSNGDQVPGQPWYGPSSVARQRSRRGSRTRN